MSYRRKLALLRQIEDNVGSIAGAPRENSDAAIRDAVRELRQLIDASQPEPPPARWWMEPESSNMDGPYLVRDREEGLDLLPVYRARDAMAAAVIVELLNEAESDE